MYKYKKLKKLIKIWASYTRTCKVLKTIKLFDNEIKIDIIKNKENKKEDIGNKVDKQFILAIFAFAKAKILYCLKLYKNF